MLSYHLREQWQRQMLGMESKRFDEMFEPYRKAFIFGSFEQQNSIIEDFVSSLLLAETSKIAEERTAEKNANTVSCCVKEDKSLEDILKCSLCQELFHVPVTLSCGHTFCSDCLANSQHHQGSTVCPGCGQHCKLQYTANIAVQELQRMWLPEKSYIRSRIAEARKLLDEQNMMEFMALVENILIEHPENVEILCLRAHGYTCLKSNTKALSDLDFAYSIAPFCSKVLHARGELLASMAQPEEAMTMYVRAAALRPEESRYRCSLSLYLGKLIRNICDSAIPCLQDHTTLSAKCTYTEEASGKSRKKLVRNLPIPKPNTAQASAMTERSSSVFVNVEPQAPTEPNEKTNELLDNEDNSYYQHKETVKPTKRKTSSFALQPQVKTNIPSELECKLCFNLVYDPVTTPCGHSLCRCCLQRCLDHRSDCPYCRTNLQSFLEYLLVDNIGTCEVLKRILLLKFKEDYELRRIAHEKELLKFSRCENEIPIFVCALALPGIACPLHIFEPRYKLMIRRCLKSSSRQFGMCVPDPVYGFATVGTMLYIDEAKFLPDGRSVIHTVGSRRFKVLERGLRDGYNTASVQWLEDELEEEDCSELNNEVYSMMTRWIEKLPAEQLDCIVTAVGPVPDAVQTSSKNGPHWLWWLLAAMPLNVEAKRIILSMTSVTERLNSAKRFLAILLSRQQ